MVSLSAISLASNIIDFIGFSWGLIKGTKEIYRSTKGTLDENERLEVVIRDLGRISKNLSRDTTGSTDSELAVKQLAEDCREDSAQLLAHLEKLKVRGQITIWKSLKSKFLSLMSKDEIDALKGRLEFYRSEINTNLILILQ